MAEAKFVSHDLSSLLSSEERDFLVRNNGNRVKIKDLIGKNVGLYFSASWYTPCGMFTPTLVDVYNKVCSKGDIEIVFISSDKDEDSFTRYFSKMPWLAIPFSDSATINSVKANFGIIRGSLHLVFLDKDGNFSTEGTVQLVIKHKADAYPFTSERFKELKEEEENARRNQSLISLLVSKTRDFVISSDGSKVPVSDLEGKMVGLYFCISSYAPCTNFTEKLVKIYKTLKEKGENFEIVSLFMDKDNEGSEKEALAQLSWFCLPFKDDQIEKLAHYFELRTIPRLVIIGSDGKTLNTGVAELIDEHGIAAYPFTSDRLAELAEIEKAKFESQTLHDLLISGDKDYVIDKTGSKVPLSRLVGKHLLIYFSAHWCPPCRAFTPKLIKTYHEIKAKQNAFEIIFVSSDRDQSSFESYYSSMPWLALPFGDERKGSLSRRLKVNAIPFLVAVGPEGKTVTTEARHLITNFGADAFPFTEDHIKNLKE